MKESEIRNFLEKNRINRDCRNGVLLRTACASRHESMARVLVDDGADPTVSLNMPIILACRNNHYRLVEHLIEKGADVNARGGEALCTAAERGASAMVAFLIKKGADPNVNFDKPLLCAARGGQMEIARLLIENHGASADSRNYAALQTASAAGREDIVLYLLSKVDTQSNSRPLSIALKAAGKNCMANVVELLLQRGATWKALYESHSSSKALSNNPVEVIKYAFEVQAISAFQAETLFEEAAGSGNAKAINYMLDNVVVTREQMTAGLEASIAHGHTQVTTVLWEKIYGHLKKAELDSLLFVALVAGSVEWSCTIHSAGGRLHRNAEEHVVCAAAASGFIHRIPLQFASQIRIRLHAQIALGPAIESGRIETVELLKSHGAIMSGQGCNFYFERAIVGGKVCMLKYLLSIWPTHVIDYSACLYHAAATGSTEILDFLKEQNTLLPSIEEDRVVEALTEAATRGNTSVLYHLLSLARVSSEAYSHVVQRALYSGNDESVRILLNCKTTFSAHFDRLRAELLDGDRLLTLSSRWISAALNLANDLSFGEEELVSKAAALHATPHGIARIRQHFASLILSEKAAL